MLSRLDMMLNIQVIKFQKVQSLLYGDTPSIVITDDEINLLLKNSIYSHSAGGEGLDFYRDLEEDGEIKNLRGELGRKEKEIREKTGGFHSQNDGSFLALPYLAHKLKLSSLEIDAIIICLAVQIDIQITKKYERIYAYLNDNLTQKKPTIDLVLALEYPSIVERIRAKPVLSKDGLLFRYNILQQVENDKNYEINEHPIKIDDRVANFLLGMQLCDSRLSSIAKIIPPTKPNNGSLIYEAGTIEKIHSLLSIIRKNQNNAVCQDQGQWSLELDGQKIVLNFSGPKGSGRKSLSNFICSSLGYHLLMIDVAEAMSRGTQIDELLFLSFREAFLLDCPLYLANFDLLIEKEKGKEKENNDKIYLPIQSLAKNMQELSWLTFVETGSSWNHGGVLNDCFFMNLDFKVSEFKTRKLIWESFAKQEDKTCPLRIDKTVDFNLIAGKFIFTPGKIRDAFVSARNLAIARKASENVGEPTITMDDLYQSCKMHSNQELSSMAKKIHPNYTWVDIVLPLSSITLLKDICNAVKHRVTVFSDWGFGSKFSIGKGLTALFTGESGTGKTMAAEVIAKELNLDLYKIDLSSILSKYIGETEKNLNTIFKESEGSNSILFFDEADALFGKRTDVKDSHDRYANIETNYLLQKIDEFEGVIILSTNYRRNIDDAFIRRMQFVIDFPFPKVKYRMEIWKKAFPNQLPKSEDIDFEFLAKTLQISGGNIKNIVINSAFLAANDGRAVCMRDLILSVRREFEKMGRPMERSGFGKYVNFLDDDEFEL